MASGKQQSFQYGEVSPQIRYMSDAASYSTGLSKLRNMYVRRTGGVSNRAGFEFVGPAPQGAIPEPGAPQGIKAFTTWSTEDNAWVTISYFFDGASWKFSRDGGPSFAPALDTPGPGADKIRFTPFRNKIFITPSLYFFGSSRANAVITLFAGGASASFGYGNPPPPTSLTLSMSAFGLAPFLEVSYLVTLTLENGNEVVSTSLTSQVIPNASTIPAAGPVLPHAQASSKAVITIVPNSQVKEINLYRGTGRGGLEGAFFRLVGKTRYDGVATTITMGDFGAESIGDTPALDTNRELIGELRGALCSAFYQQRLIHGMEAGTGASGNGVPKNIKAGDILASKIGAPEQIIAPLIYTDTGAFQFSVPITDGTPVVALLGMERLIAFTERGVYVIRGGEQGILTPSTVNPLLISEEGCSTRVEPKMVGKRGYFMNNAHTKLMSIEFGADGNLDVRDIAVMSEHLLLEEVVELEVLNDTENKVFLLRRDGKLISITVSEEGVAGFSLIETAGYIESIYRGKAKKKYIPNAVGQQDGGIYYDVLMAYVIRFGSRSLERLNLREDRFREGEMYADCANFFGWRLEEYGSLGYLRIAEPRMSTYYDFDPAMFLNIKSTATTWAAGEIIKVRATGPLTSVQNLNDYVIDFYYDDENGVKQTLRYIVDYNSEVTISGDGAFVKEVSGHFLSEVPPSLRNVAGQSGLPIPEKNRRHTRWCPAIKLLDANIIPGAFSSVDNTTPEPKAVSVFADGEVLSSPLNPYKPKLYIEYNDTFETFGVNLPDYYAYGYVGQAYTSEMETLDLETAGDRTLTDANKLINSAGTAFFNTRGGFVGMQDQALENMQEIVTREDPDFGIQTENFNGHIVTHIPAEWNEKGRINIKQVDPAPITVLSVYPKGISGD